MEWAHQMTGSNGKRELGQFQSLDFVVLYFEMETHGSLSRRARP